MFYFGNTSPCLSFCNFFYHSHGGLFFKLGICQNFGRRYWDNIFSCRRVFVTFWQGGVLSKPRVGTLLMTVLTCAGTSFYTSTNVSFYSKCWCQFLLQCQCSVTTCQIANFCKCMISIAELICSVLKLQHPAHPVEMGIMNSNVHTQHSTLSTSVL